jgi:CTP synthase
MVVRLAPPQVVPHITDAIQDWIQRVASQPVDGKGVPDVCVIELGGTVGDIESAPFVEALRQFCIRAGDGNICNVHVSLVPVIGEPSIAEGWEGGVKGVGNAER